MLFEGTKPTKNNSQSVSLAVIDAVAEREGVDLTEIEPPEYESLYSVINPEALDALFAPREDGSPRANGRVLFHFCGYEVTVTDDGTVELSD